MEWIPIDSKDNPPPKGDIEILGFVNIDDYDRGYISVISHNGKEWIDIYGAPLIAIPTHWMQLPLPPTKE